MYAVWYGNIYSDINFSRNFWKGGGGCAAARMDELPVLLILMTDTESERDDSLDNSLVYGACSGVNICKMCLF